MNREDSLKKIESEEKWDVIIIGGGATGLGIALDSTTRGLKTLLIEKGDFANGTSSKSTKLIHGGVRYLKQLQFKLVFEAIRERGILLKNASHLSETIPFIIPVYSYWEMIYYSIGLFIYQMFSLGTKIGITKILSKKETLSNLTYINSQNLKGGIKYFDGQFNDSQLCIDIAFTASQRNATVINYFELIDILKTDNIVTGIKCIDKKTLKSYSIKCDNLINATGVYADNILKLDTPNKSNIILPSQGIHIVINDMNLNENALMLPLKFDNKVLFVIPWMGKQIIGTTDSKINKIEDDPEALKEEIDFLLNNFNKICKYKINKNDIQSVYTGLRPLVNINNTNNNTSFVSREHTILINKSKMITIVGGKWTTYRKMAEEVTNIIFKMNKNYKREICKTRNLSLNTNDIKNKIISNLLKNDNSLSEKVHEKYAFRKVDVLYSIKYEMATSTIDFLARRNRILFLDVKSSIESAPMVAKIFAKYLNKDLNWINNEIINFENYSKKYLPK